MVFEAVDFSKTYPAKSGDLISYFYRSSNLIRAVAFKNPADLSAEKQDNSNKALVLLEDYVGTGTQFLFEVYSKLYRELFNSYKKIYFVVLVATKNAINKFTKLTNADYDSLSQDIFSTLARLSQLRQKNGRFVSRNRVFGCITPVLQFRLS